MYTRISDYMYMYLYISYTYTHTYIYIYTPHTLDIKPDFCGDHTSNRSNTMFTVHSFGRGALA